MPLKEQTWEDSLMFLSPTNAPLYYTYKMLKYTVKTSHYYVLTVYFNILYV